MIAGLVFGTLVHARRCVRPGVRHAHQHRHKDRHTVESLYQSLPACTNSSLLHETLSDEQNAPRLRQRECRGFNCGQLSVALLYRLFDRAEGSNGNGFRSELKRLKERKSQVRLK